MVNVMLAVLNCGLVPAPTNINHADVEGGVFIARNVTDDKHIIGEQDGYSDLVIDLSAIGMSADALRAIVGNGTLLVGRPDRLWVVIQPLDGRQAITLDYWRNR